MKIVSLFVSITLICFVFSPKMQAIGPEPNGGDLIVNMAEEDDAVVELGSDTAEAAMGQAANTPNKREINLNFKKPLQCAGGDVILRGNVLITFKHISLGKVVPTSLKLEGFTGTAVNGKIIRKLEAKNLKFGGGLGGFKVTHDNGRGDGQFDFEFIVTGPGLPGGGPLRIRVLYQMNKYIFHEGEVKKLTPDNRPVVRCNP